MNPPIHPKIAPKIAPNIVIGIKKKNEPETRLPKKNEIAPVTKAFLVPTALSLNK